MTSPQLQLFENVFRQMKSGLIVASSSDNIVFINAAARKLLGISPDLNISEISLSEELSELIEAVLVTGEEQELELALNFSASLNYLQVRTQMVATDDTKAAVVVMYDVTRLHKLENVRREFVANVSHELKTPITSIKAAAETLQDGASKDPESEERFLGIISRQAERLNTIIEDLLSLSRLENEPDAVAFEDLELSSLLREAIRNCEFKARQRDTKVILNAPGNCGLKGNITLLEQALVNLIDNAVKYSDPGTEVNVKAEVSGSEVIIKIIDRGRGIAPEHHARIFERFYRVDKARSRREGGSGLGLSIVKHIAQIHGGRAAVESEPGQGSTFSLILPLAARS